MADFILGQLPRSNLETGLRKDRIYPQVVSVLYPVSLQPHHQTPQLSLR